MHNNTSRSALAGLLTKAPAGARQINDDGRRTDALVALAPHLPADRQAQVWAEALAAVGQTGWEDWRAEVLAALAGPMADLPPLRACTLLQEVLPVLARHPRHELPADLPVLLAQPLRASSGAQAAATTAEAVIAVGK